MKSSRSTFRTYAAMIAAVVALAVLAACSAPEGLGAAGSVERVTINGGDDVVTVAVDQTVPLGIEVVAAAGTTTDVTWSSNRNSVASIDAAGRLTGHSVGTATITATSVADGRVGDTIEVNVTAEDGDPSPTGGPVPSVNSVTIAGGAESRTLDVGAEITLPVTVDTTGGADASVSWASSDDAIVTVSDEGLVTAVAEGTATVTATSVADASVSDDIEIVVVSDGSGEDGDDGPTAEVTNVTIEEGAESVSVPEGGSLVLDVSVDATGGADTSVVWSSADPSLATVDGAGTVSGVGAGSTTVTATSTFDADVSDTITVIVEAADEPEPTDPPAGIDVLVTVADEDSDPYALQGWTGEEPIPGTLRHALAIAEPGDVIGFDEGIDEVVVTGVDTENMGTGDEANHVDAHLIFRDDVTVVGPPGGLTIRAESGYEEGSDPDDGAGGFTYRSRVMFVVPGAQVTLENITITGGDFIYLGGGIRNDGDLTLRNVVVTGNRAWTYGGGVFNNGGTLTLHDSDITGNGAYTTAEELDRGSYDIRGEYTITMSDTGYAGGLYVPGGTVTIDGTSEIATNEAKYFGGGISMTGGSVVASGTRIAGNVAEPSARGGSGDSGGGGVSVFGGTFDLDDGTIHDNVSGVYGGGLQLMSGGNAVLTDVFFEGNSAQYGDAIFHQYANEPSDNLTLEGGNVTVGGPGYYPPDAGESMALRASPSTTPTLPDPGEHPDWRR